MNLKYVLKVDFQCERDEGFTNENLSVSGLSTQWVLYHLIWVQENQGFCV